LVKNFVETYIYSVPNYLNPGTRWRCGVSGLPTEYTYVVCAGHTVNRRVGELQSLLQPFGEEDKSYSAVVNPTTIPRSSSPLPSHYIYPDSTNVIHTEQS
jgi:hypothetical protein